MNHVHRTTRLGGLIVVLAGFIMTSIANCETATTVAPVSDVVAAYCYFDADGFRISTANYEKIRNLMAWDEDQDEPGWDCFKVIAGYKINDEAIHKKKASVKVQYEIVGTICGRELTQEKYIDSVEFQLVQIDEKWKIKEYVPYPRISVNTAIAFFEKWLERSRPESSDNSKNKSQVQTLITELKGLRRDK